VPPRGASYSQKKYGLVLSDWEMQPMGGELFLKALRRNSKVPVILITGKAGRGVSWLAGANAYLAKPFTERDLETAIKRALMDHPG
jgi:CheY-like chemotaxis protein